MKKTILSIAAVVCFGTLTNVRAQSNVNHQSKKDKKVEISNKEKAAALLKSFETGDKEPISYINPEKYIQHNLAVANGLAGFKAFAAKRPPNSVKINTVRAFEDGDYVFLQTEYNAASPRVGFDIFRFENGQIVEHWDNLQEKARPNPSNHTMTDGTTTVADLDKTEANKKLVQSFVDDILVNGKMEKLAPYFNGDNYIQHNPAIPYQLSGLGKALGEWAAQGITMKYDNIHKVLGYGNFVLVISEGHLAGKLTSFYDLFRIENGKIAEHWDVIETIAPKSEWKNDNGKFNFPK